MVAVLGSGGHGEVIVQLLKASAWEVKGVYDDNEEVQCSKYLGFTVFPMSALPKDSPAIIAIGSNAVRRKVDMRFPATQWVTAVHPSAVVDPTATLGEGTVVMAGAVIQAGVKVGRHVVVNTRSSIDHGCVVGDYATVAPGATLCGTVTLGEGAWVGAGATVKERLTISPGCVLGAGATLVKNMAADSETWVGLPAAPLKAKVIPAQAILPPSSSKSLGWIWPKWLDGAVFMKHLEASTLTGQFTNHGPAAKALEVEAARRLHISKHAVLAVCSGTAALHAMLAVHIMCGASIAGGILVSAFGFPPILQANWKTHIRMTDIDPVHGGPFLPRHDERPPAAVCLVNPFGYCVDVAYYRQYCDRLGIPLWMDNASSPLTFLPDGTPVSEMGDMVSVSLHETKAIGRGEGGLLLVPKENEVIARRAVNFGYDSTLPPHQRALHVEASNWRMGDFQAAAILANWELGFDIILQWMDDNDRDIVDVGPFKRGLRGSIMSCLLENRQPRPTMEIKYYYQPMGPHEQFPECWRVFNAFQARPFHP